MIQLFGKKIKHYLAKKGHLRNIFEYILFFTKTDQYKFYADKIRIFDTSQLKEWWVKFPERYNPKGALPSNVWEYPIPTQGSWTDKSIRHSNPLPAKIIERILLLTTDQGDVVLDPFAGSGIVLAVADFLKRHWFGFEMNQKYCDMFRNYTLKEIREEMMIDQKRENELGLLSSKFEELIKKLRLVKFPKSLVKELQRKNVFNNNNSILNTIFAISEKPKEDVLSSLPEHKFLIEDLFLIFNHIENDIEEKQINEVILKPPLCKFGIEPRTYLLSKEEFVLKYRNKLDNFPLWLYSFGTVHKFDKQVNFQQWLEEVYPKWQNYSKYGIPPIISNIKVNQKVPKKWKSRDEKFNILKQKIKNSIGNSI